MPEIAGEGSHQPREPVGAVGATPIAGERPALCSASRKAQDDLRAGARLI